MSAGVVLGTELPLLVATGNRKYVGMSRQLSFSSLCDRNCQSDEMASVVTCSSVHLTVNLFHEFACQRNIRAC
jgi:hypothetical protein